MATEVKSPEVARIDSGEKCRYCRQVWIVGRICEGCGMPAKAKADKPARLESCQKCNRGYIVPIGGGRGVCRECGSQYAIEEFAGFVSIDAKGA